MTSSLFGEKVNSSHVTSSPCDEFTVSPFSALLLVIHCDVTVVLPQKINSVKEESMPVGYEAGKLLEFSLY